MTLTTYSDTQSLPAGLGLTAAPARRRRTARVWLDRVITRLHVRYALWSVRADLETIPTFVLSDIGIPADDIDHAVRTATLVVIRRAIRAKLERVHGLKNRGSRWTT